LNKELIGLIPLLKGHSLMVKIPRLLRNKIMVTKHQKINRYNEADYRWEVRCDEEAVDIHIS
jgi:hypothetical protein